MEKSLNKTIIKVDQGFQLLYSHLTKFHKYGCKAIFYRPDNENIYDVTVFSKSLLQLNHFSETALMNIKNYQHLNSKIVCPITSITEDLEFIYIVSEGADHKLSDLVHKREGLTEFQIIYFLLNLIEVINYMKSRDIFYQFLDIDEMFLTSNMKIMVPFSIWVSSIGFTKQMVFRHEDKKKFICPEVLKVQGRLGVDEVNSWNVGVFIYQLVEAKKPFIGKNDQLKFSKQISPQLETLIRKLLRPNPQVRLKFPLILVQPIFKKYSVLPHLLPNTIFSCPPSNQFISSYEQQFEEEPVAQISDSSQMINVKTAFQLEIKQSDKQENEVKNFHSTQYLKSVEWNVSETLYYVGEFVDISDDYGFGYQMNTGLVGFVFNDGTKMLLENSKKSVTYYNEKKQSVELKLDNVSEQGLIKKKIHILQAYVKSIKKFRQPIHQNGKPVTVSQYLRTKCSNIFLLTNQALQIIFADKMTIILSKKIIYVHLKNSDKFQLYDEIAENNDVSLRKQYALTIANKLFNRDIDYLNPNIQQ